MEPRAENQNDDVYQVDLEMKNQVEFVEMKLFGRKEDLKD